MRLLLANYRYFLSGGPERYLFNIENALSDRGHEIIPFSVTYPANRPSPYADYFISPLGSPDAVYFRQQKMTPATVAKTLSRLFYSREAEAAALRLVRDTRPQAAYVLHYLRKISPSLLVALKKEGIPIIVRLSDYAMLCPQTHCIRQGRPCTLCMESGIFNSIRYNCVTGGRPAAVLNALATWFHRFKGYFNLIDTFVTTNDFMAEMMARAGWPEAKLVCIPTFTNTRTFSPLHPGEKDRGICFSGRLEAIKGVDILLEAFSRVPQRPEHPIHLTIAGNGQPETITALKERTATLGLTDRVRFAGHLDDAGLGRLLSRSSLSVVPSICFENLPNTLLESLACGTPVLASDLGSLSRSIIPGKTGDLFRAGDPEDLSRKLQYYLDRPDLMGEMGRLARQQALDTYSAPAHVDRLEQVIQKLVNP